MTDYQTLEWLLTKLRNAETLNSYFAARITELEAKPAERSSPWRTLLEAEPPFASPVLFRWKNEGGDIFCTVADWRPRDQRFDSYSLSVPATRIIAWMLIPECDK